MSVKEPATLILVRVSRFSHSLTLSLLVCVRACFFRCPFRSTIPIHPLNVTSAEYAHSHNAYTNDIVLGPLTHFWCFIFLLLLLLVYVYVYVCMLALSHFSFTPFSLSMENHFYYVINTLERKRSSTRLINFEHNWNESEFEIYRKKTKTKLNINFNKKNPRFIWTRYTFIHTSTHSEARLCL